MQYIECIHCHKRYAATQKMKDAMGRKKVRCTECGKSFPIIIYNAGQPGAADAAGGARSYLSF